MPPLRLSSPIFGDDFLCAELSSRPAARPQPAQKLGLVRPRAHDKEQSSIYPSAVNQTKEMLTQSGLRQIAGCGRGFCFIYILLSHSGANGISQHGRLHHVATAAILNNIFRWKRSSHGH